MDKRDSPPPPVQLDTVAERVEPELDTQVFTELTQPVTLVVKHPAPEERPGRYTSEEDLGQGGMGKVVLCHDQQIGRRVALKMIRPDLQANDVAVNRFVREARIQGQLEHPAMVPVYDLGIESDGAAFFTMKRVRGVTLKEILKDVRKGRNGARERYSLRKLLTAFGNVCLAVDFAHQRGVLHRDIKPSNIMLGDFGEVYLLDWGIAKLMDEEDQPAGVRRRDTIDPASVDESDTSVETDTGHLLGTAGFIAPEQIHGTPEASRPTADIYALGAVLFQILTGQRLHEPGPRHRILARTATGVEARPSVRAPERNVAPELETICVRATALEPDDRFPTARELHDSIERYLDGRRDEEMRRTLAARHAQAAADTLRRARDHGQESLTERRLAMRDIGRALALDPENDKALDTMVQVLTQPPDDLPREVSTQIRREDEGQIRWTAGLAGLVYLSFFLYLPVILYAGVRNTTLLTVFYALVLLSSGISFWITRLRHPSQNEVLLAHVVSTVSMASLVTFFGPLVLMPALVAVNTAGFALVLVGRHRLYAVVISCLVVIVPMILEATGVMFASYRFAGGEMIIQPNAIFLPKTATIVLLGVGALSTILTAVFAVSRVRDSLANARRQIFLNNWLIRQLVPASAPPRPDRG